MLPIIVTAAVLWADLVSPVTQAEYAHVMRQVAVCHEPLSPEARASYHAKGRFLAGFLRPGMTDLEVRQVLGGRPSGWVQDGDWWTDTYGLLRLSVRYRVADVEAAGQGLPGLVLEEVVESTQP